MIEILLLIFFVVSAFGIGAKIMKALGLSSVSGLEFFVLSEGLGVGLISLCMFIMGIFRLFYWSSALGLLIATFVLGFSEIRNFFKKLNFRKILSSKTSLSTTSKIIVSILFLFILINFIKDLTPPLNPDTLIAYLMIPKLWVYHHSIYSIDFLGHDDLPLNIQMLSCLGLLLRSDLLSQLLVGWLMGVLSCFAIYILACRYFDKEIAIIASIIFYTMPVVSWLSFSAKIDLGWTFFELLGIFAFSIWFMQKKILAENRRWLYLSAIYFGLALGTKYYSLFSVCLFAIAILYKILWVNRGQFNKRSISTFFIFVSTSLLIASPYYIKNFIFTGNPVYPVFSSSHLGPYGQQVFSYSSTPWSYLKMIWNFSFGKEFVVRPIIYMPGVPYGGVLLALLPGLFIAKSKLPSTAKYLGLYCLAFSLFLFWSPLPRPRHMLPAAAILAILASIGYLRLLSVKPLLSKIAPVFLIGFVFFYLYGAVGGRTLSVLKEQMRFLAGRETRQEYLKRKLFDKRVLHFNSEMIEYVDKHTPENTRILTLYFHEGYYINRVIFKDEELRHHFVFVERNPEDFLCYLKKHRAGYIFLNDYSWDYKKDIPGYSQNTLILEKEFQQKYMKEVFSCKGQHLYKILYPEVTDSLQNIK